MNKLKGLIAASAAALSLYSADAIAQERIETESRIEHRLEHPLAQQQGGEPDFFTLTGEGAFFAGINGIELNHQLVGYGVGGKINLHIGLGSKIPYFADSNDDRLSLGLELSDMFVANVTGGVYDGFVNNINADLSLSVLDPSVGGSAYLGTGLTLIDTIDPWLNHDMNAYANVHVGGRLLFSEFGSLELEAGLITDGEDNGFYTSLGFGVALPGIN
ncbi:MAG: hypothetical protein WC852_01390 [Candidatus Nanoarchaeia archaeon]|jgi:hypothetical protein